MAWLPDGEKNLKISLFVLAQLKNVTDTRTDGHRVTAYTALMYTHRAVKIVCSETSSMPWARKTLRAYKVCALELI